MNKKKISFNSVLFLTGFFLSLSSFAEEAVFDFSKPSVSLEMLIMPGGAMGGGALNGGVGIQSEDIDFNFSLGYGNSKAPTGEVSLNLWGPEIRLGKRFSLHNNNYLVVGMDYTWAGGIQDGFNVTGSFTAGPYVGITRRFPNSNVLIFAFSVIYNYDYEKTSAGAVVSHYLMSDGGVGISYLF